MDLKDYIIKESRSLGFSRTGVAPPRYNPKAHNRFLRWLGNGRNAGMGYMERATRLRFDPKIHLAGAKSVIVCAHNYYSDPVNDPRKGYISIYARGDDYHIVMRNKLTALCDSIKGRFGKFNYKIYVDSSPISEKTFAVMAGIGFIGKNSTVIIPKNKTDGAGPLGSFHFLGVIISDLDLPYDSATDGTCGKCVKCIEACPTGAIIDDGEIDARKCLSYHNTQNKGDIPDEIAPQMGNMIFGCDICQLVCPYNSKAVETEETRFWPRAGVMDIDPRRVVDLDEKDFENNFADTGIADFGYRYFKRNVMLVLKNMAANFAP